jgi:hypothetical protein
MQTKPLAVISYDTVELWLNQTGPIVSQIQPGRINTEKLYSETV